MIVPHVPAGTEYVTIAGTVPPGEIVPRLVDDPPSIERVTSLAVCAQSGLVTGIRSVIVSPGSATPSPKVQLPPETVAVPMTRLGASNASVTLLVVAPTARALN